MLLNTVEGRLPSAPFCMSFFEFAVGGASETGHKGSLDVPDEVAAVGQSNWEWKCSAQQSVQLTRQIGYWCSISFVSRFGDT